jgi:hypothetical protein
MLSVSTVRHISTLLDFAISPPVCPENPMVDNPISLACAKALIKLQIIAQCYQQNGHLFAMGNGGSSCDAAHITTQIYKHLVS